MASHAVPHTCWMRRDSKTSCPIRQLGSMGADLVLAKGPSTELPTNQTCRGQIGSQARLPRGSHHRRNQGAVSSIPRPGVHTIMAIGAAPASTRLGQICARRWSTTSTLA
jgi:hypothetical protein